MRLITTCPKCNTAFIIKPEHLAAHRGDVRCGHCQHLFNALEHLAESTTDEALASAPALHQADEEAVPEPEPLATEPESTVEVEQTPEVALTPVEEVLLNQEIDTTALDFVLESAHEPEDAPPPDEDSSQVTVEAEEGTYPALIDPAAEPEPEPEPSIVRLESAHHKLFVSPSAPRRRGFFWILGVASLLLLLLAIGQISYFLRTDIATRLPQAKPWLQHACATLGCTVDLPKQIDLLVIDDSNLQEDADHEGVVRLTSTLINRAHYAQAYPQLELTLTDLDDHAVLRRTFAPQEYLPKGTHVESGIRPDEELHVKLAIANHASKAAGYRVFITYP